MKWTLQQIAEWTHANILSTYEREFVEIGTDTRDRLNGKVFIALKGESYDAHQFLDQAVQQGAAALIVHELPEQFKFLKEKVSILFVKDTLQALQDWAQAYRQNLKTQIIGITGSNGKTTTKEFTAQILSTFKKVHFNQGSFNNHWGVPLTLLQIPQDADFAVIEMGMNHPGEIAYLAQIGAPTVALITNAPLTGAHERVSCAGCHQGRDALNPMSRCGQCHTDRHRGQLGEDCARCHSTATFKTAIIRQ